METKELQNKIMQEAKSYFLDMPPSHNWNHVERVYNLALEIGKKENVDLFILSLAALLHDIGRKQELENPECLDHSEISAKLAKPILEKYNIDTNIINKVIHCISSHRFRKDKKPESKEAKVLFDADKLDSIGAIGIARAYAWAGEKNIKLYSDKNYLGTGYEQEHSPVTEFTFKLSKVKSRLYTETAKQIAESRHKFMEEFFNQLKREVE